MCGIAGFFGSGDHNTLSRMLHQLAHRGPDAQGVEKDPNLPLFLGHQRLEILDKKGGGQPMLSDQHTLIFNGEIYNHQQLRHELEQLGHTFLSSHSDTETLLHAWQEWGTNCLSKLNGMFAFCIWDRKTKTIHLARDRFGEKPLYYYHAKNCLAFASELTALTAHPNVPKTISNKQLQRFFAFNFIPSPGTIYDSIYKLEPGQHIAFNTTADKLSKHTYYQPTIHPEKLEAAETVFVDQLDALLNNAVKERLVSDVPLGGFLSGGIDSSLICAMASKASNGDFQAFTAAVTPKSYDESPYARQVAKALGIELHVESVSFDHAEKLCPKLLSLLDEPFGDYSFIPTYLVCQAAKKHATVALGGDGADELFAGYETFRGLNIAKLLSMTGKLGTKTCLSLANFLPSSNKYMSFDYKIKQMLRGLIHDEALWNTLWLSGLSLKDFKDFFCSPIDSAVLFEDVYAFWHQHNQLSLFEKTQLYYLRYYMGDGILTKVDRASMLNALEVRSPFLDHHLVEFALNLPTSYKFRHGKGKYLLRKVAERYLPKEIVYRKKHGFSVPLKKWLPELPVQPVLPTLLHKDHTQQFIEQDCTGTADHRQFLWDLYALDCFTQGLQT